MFSLIDKYQLNQRVIGRLTRNQLYQNWSCLFTQPYCKRVVWGTLNRIIWCDVNPMLLVCCSRYSAPETALCQVCSCLAKRSKVSTVKCFTVKVPIMYFDSEGPYSFSMFHVVHVQMFNVLKKTFLCLNIINHKDFCFYCFI